MNYCRFCFLYKMILFSCFGYLYSVNFSYLKRCFCLWFGLQFLPFFMTKLFCHFSHTFTINIVLRYHGILLLFENLSVIFKEYGIFSILLSLINVMPLRHVILISTIYNHSWFVEIGQLYKKLWGICWAFGIRNKNWHDPQWIQNIFIINSWSH